MSDRKLKRKLKRKLRKFYRWARRHGLEHADMFVVGPDGDDQRWYGYAMAKDPDGDRHSVSKFYGED